MNEFVPLGPSSATLPTLVAAAGKRASMRFLEFFAANIRNPHTRRAYFRASEEFLAWCASAGVPSIVDVQPVQCSDMDRGRDARTGGALGQATARGTASSVRLVGQRPGDAAQPGARPHTNSQLKLAFS